MNNYTASDFESAYRLNKILIAILFAAILATAILSTIPGFLDMVFAALGGK